MSLKLAALAMSLPLALLAAPASAQDCSGGTFAGFYTGSGLGFARSSTKQTSPGSDDLSQRDTVFAGSSFAGYNLQCGTVILGIEGELGHLGLQSNGTWVDPVATTSLTDKIGWYSTLRGRVGVAVHDNAMIYVTGGFAFADVTHKIETPAFAFEQKDGGWRTGWTIGGGGEMAIDKNWLVRAEALFIDLGNETHDYTVVGGCGGVCTATAKWEDSFWVGRVGLIYKFGAGEPRHQPLK